MKISPDTVVIITGGSRGIGRETAFEFAKKGAKIAIASRNQEKMDETASKIYELGGKASTFRCDVSKEEDCSKMVEDVLGKFGHVDVLINNAGYGHYASIEKVDTEALDAILKTNLFGAIWCTQAILPHMKSRKKGHIVNVSTVISKRSIPFMTAYCMSKFAMNAMDEGLRLEVRKDGIRVSLVCPGLTSTDFQTNAGKIGYQPPVSNDGGMNANRVGKAIFKAVRRNRRRVNLTVAGKFLITMNRISPWLVDELMYLAFSRKHPDSI